MSWGEFVYFLRFSGAFYNPWLRLFPSFVESEEAGLASAFDQLIGLCNKLCGLDPGGKLSVCGDRTGLRIPRDLSDLWRRVNEVWGDGRRRMNWGSSLKPKGEEKLCVVLADG